MFCDGSVGKDGERLLYRCACTEKNVSGFQEKWEDRGARNFLGTLHVRRYFTGIAKDMDYVATPHFLFFLSTPLMIPFFLYFSRSSQGPRVDNRRRKQQWQIRVARQDRCGPVSSGHPSKLPGQICHVLVAALNLKLLKNCIEKNRH